jgi:hypothetical protein
MQRVTEEKLSKPIFQVKFLFMATKRTSARRTTSIKSKGIIENPPARLKKNPWVKYKWTLIKPIEKGETASQNRVEKDVTKKLNKLSQDFIPIFSWKANKSGLIWRLRVGLKPVNPPSTGTKTPQPPPPPPTFP